MYYIYRLNTIYVQDNSGNRFFERSLISINTEDLFQGML